MSTAALTDAAAARRPRGRPIKTAGSLRDGIIDAAQTSFALQGYDGATLRGIAAAAGVDVALVSRQFGGKFELWRTVVDGLADHLDRAHACEQEGLEADGPIGLRLREMIRRFVAANAQAPQLGRIFISEVSLPGRRRDYLLDRVWRRDRKALLPLLQQGREAGFLPPNANPEYLLLILIGATVMPLMIQAVLPTCPSVEAHADQLAANLELLFINHPN